MRLPIALAALFAGCLPALASGGASCKSEGGAARIGLAAGVTHGMGSPVIQLEATVDVPDQKIAADLRSSTFTRENLTQYWSSGEDLRFYLYRERNEDGFASVEVAIDTKATGEDAVHGGKYVVTITQPGAAEPLKFEGQVSCSME